MRGFNGVLTPEHAALGIQAALTNAEALLQEAHVLLDHERWSRAGALSILAIEEAGKPARLRSVLLARTEQERRQEWTAYRSHVDKNTMARFLEYVVASHGIEYLEELRPLVTDEIAHRETETLKQLSLYTDYVWPGEWSIPANVMDEAMARSLLRTADLVVGSGPSGMTTVPELRLWMKHLGPVWKADMKSMKRALGACYEEAAASGVLTGAAGLLSMLEFLGFSDDEDDDESPS